MKLHDLIAAARAESGVSLRVLGAETGISHSVLHQIETGHIVQPSFRNVVKISRALDLRLDDLAKTE